MDLLEIELYRQMCPRNYGDRFDDGRMDEIIWSEIGASSLKADFSCYLLHGLQNARHEEEARSRIRTMRRHSAGTPFGYRRAIEHIRGMAMQGVPECMFHMGKLHVHGIGVRKDLRLAKQWYEEAIQEGEMRAHCELGWLYLQGCDEIPLDGSEAFRLLFIGAQSGILAARASLGMMLLTGEGVPANVKLGLDMLRGAFDSGYDNAGNLLADMYFLGTHLDQDIDLAHEWLHKVAARGDARTMAILGNNLVTGSHGRKDVAQGLELLHESVEKGYIFSYLWLGNLYRDGNGVERDGARAMEWFERGVTAGNEACRLALLRLMHDSWTGSGPFARLDS